MSSSLHRRPSKDELEVAHESERARQMEEEIMKRGCSWDEAKLSPEDKGLLKDFATAKAQGRIDLLNESGARIAGLLVRVLQSSHDKNTSQFVLYLIDETLQADPNFVYHLQRVGAYGECFRILDTPDAYCVEKAFRILSILLSSDPQDRQAEADRTLRYLTNRLSDSKGRQLLQVLSSLKDILKNYNNHAIFVRVGALERLESMVVRDMSNAQIVYFVGFCAWLLSYNKDMFPALRKSGILHELTTMIRTSAREKVIRVAVATFRNLLDQSAGKDHNFNEDMIGLGLLKLTQSLLPKGWKDPDITEDLKVLSTRLELTLEKLSSFEVYHAEILTGGLQWSPVHSELFWRENINKFEAKGFALVRRLVELLSESKDDICLEVACYDLGEFARFYPDGKRIIESFNGKPRLMSLLASPLPGVRKQALLATQKMMVQNWESLSKSGGGGGGKKSGAAAGPK